MHILRIARTQFRKPIGRNPTVQQESSPAAPLTAAERADLLAQIGTAQAELHQLLSQLGNDAGSVLVEGQAQRQLLAQLERSLASGIALPSASVRNEIAGVIASTAYLGQQARTANEDRRSLELATAQARTRATILDIGRDIYERRIFDPYLQFGSAEEEAAYRRREEENRRAIDEALAENTPEGDLRAARLIKDQLADAGAHGADASPEFASRMTRINSDIEDLERAAVSPQQGQPESRRESGSSPRAPQSPPPASEDQLASVLAAFRAAGIAGGVAAEQSAHGLGVDASAPGRSQTALI